MIKLEYKGNLEKDIKSFKRKFDFEKSFKKHLLNDTIISAVMTLVGVYGFKLDVFNSFSKVFITVAVLSAMSMIKEKVEINVSKKKAIRNLRDLSKELNKHLDKSKGREKPLINASSFRNASQRTELREVVNSDSKGESVSKQSDTIKDYFLLDRHEKINILRQIKSTIKYNSGKSVKDNNLYLLSDNEYYAEYDSNTLSLKK